MFPRNEKVKQSVHCFGTLYNRQSATVFWNVDHNMLCEIVPSVQMNTTVLRS